jgi:hypothetical protein
VETVGKALEEQTDTVDLEVRPHVNYAPALG